MRTRLYGLNIDSELTIHEQRGYDGQPDLTIRVGEPIEAVQNPPAGRRLLHLEIDKQFFTATDQDAGYVLRFYGTCDFEIDRDLASVTARVVPGVDLDRVAVLAAGTMVSFVLALQGKPVLHASAVQIGDGALAFVGRSGMGKSTMATLMCADGAEIITDDVLRLDLTGDVPACHLGATELRLRKAAGDLAARFDERPSARVTGDDRDALRMPAATQDLLPLRAIVIPAPDHSDVDREPEVTRLSARDALLHLLQFPRIVGWEDPAALQGQFGDLAKVVAAVPVFVARLPWGPPFPPGIAEHVRDATGMTQLPAAASTASR